MRRVRRAVHQIAGVAHSRRDVPGRGYQQKYERPREELVIKQAANLARHSQKRSDDDRGKGSADQSFGEDRERAEDVDPICVT